MGGGFHKITQTVFDSYKKNISFLQKQVIIFGEIRLVKYLSSTWYLEVCQCDLLRKGMCHVGGMCSNKLEFKLSKRGHVQVQKYYHGIGISNLKQPG